MKTPMQELLALIPDAREIKEYISEVQPDEKMLDEWLWERMFKGRNWIEKEKEQMIVFGKKMQLVQHVSYDDDITYCFEPEDYYKKTYNQNK